MLKHLVYMGAVLSISACGCRLEPEWNPSPASAVQMEGIETKPWGDPQAVLAEVNGRPITRGEFYVRVLRQFGTWKILTGMVKQELFLQEAERLKISVSTEEVEGKVGEILRDMAGKVEGGEVGLHRAFEREGLSMENVRRDLSREVAPQLLVGMVTRAMRKVGDQELEEYYKRTYRYTRYETRHLAYSFLPRPGQGEEDRNRLKLQAFNRAQRAADRVRNGADFATLARAESEDEVTASEGGRLGPLHEDSPMDPKLKAAVFALQEGDVSDPVENPNGGYHVFQVTRVLPEESFADCKEKMMQEILEREPDLKEIAAATEVLRGRADVKLFGSALMPPAPGNADKETLK
jgi:hypothetical protein